MDLENIRNIALRGTLTEMDYEYFVERLTKPGKDIIKTLNPTSAHLLHMAIGIAGEAGEILDCIKKHAIYGTPLDEENLVEELGDLLFYLTGILHELHYDFKYLRRKNVEKLSKRYSSGRYSDSEAISRMDKSSSGE